MKKRKMVTAMAWGDRIRDEQLDSLLARAETAHTVLLRIDQFRDLVQQAKATRPEERANETAEEACRRLGWWIQDQCEPGPYNVKGWFPSKAMRAFLEGFEAGQATRSPQLEPKP